MKNVYKASELLNAKLGLDFNPKLPVQIIVDKVIPMKRTITFDAVMKKVSIV